MRIQSVLSMPRRLRLVERRRDLDPTILFSRDHPDLFGHFGEVLILAEDHGHVVFAPVGQADHVQRDADVDALLLSNQDGVFGTVGQSHRLVSVA